jgi:multidrug efflux pump subunit AcrA (membrane-fusion protein)
MKIRNTSIVILALALVPAACGRTHAASATAADPRASAPIAVEVAKVYAGSGGAVIEIPAAIESSHRAVLTSRLAAAIVAIGAREGDNVRAGAILAQLEDKALRATLSAAETSNQAAARDLARARALFAAARAQASVVAAREALSLASIRAPFSGQVSRKLVNVGDIVNPGQPLVEIEGAGGLEVAVSTEKTIHDRLRVGASIEVRIDGIATPVSAVIHDLSPSADSSTHRFSLRADLPPLEGVRAGLFARILVSSPDRDQRILVPRDAVEPRGGLTGVYVIHEGRARLRWIALGEPVGGAIEVRAGLDVGERVALQPSRLHDGAAIVEAAQ